MRFYTGQHRYYCGIDLHPRTMYVCILDAAGQVLVHQNLPAKPEAFLEVIASYRDDLVLGSGSQRPLVRHAGSMWRDFGDSAHTLLFSACRAEHCSTCTLRWAAHSQSLSLMMNQWRGPE